jgi:hypothetical protein
MEQLKLHKELPNFKLIGLNLSSIKELIWVELFYGKTDHIFRWEKQGETKVYGEEFGRAL